MDIAGKVFIVTGGASGLGEGTARMLAREGGKVVIADLQADRGEAVAKEIGAAFVKCDVSSEDDGKATIAKAVAKGKLVGLVNCAGIAPAARTVGKDGAHALALYAKVISVNLIGTFNMIRLAAEAMCKNDPERTGERGVIVSTASVAAFDGQIGQAAYSASKGGVVGMTLPIARDLRAIGVRINTIAPGLIDTPIYGEGEAAEQFKARLGEGVLFPKRLGSADELASMVAELITNDYVNGEVVRVDGGLRLPPK